MIHKTLLILLPLILIPAITHADVPNPEPCDGAALDEACWDALGERGVCVDIDGELECDTSDDTSDDSSSCSVSLASPRQTGGALSLLALAGVALLTRKRHR